MNRLIKKILKDNRGNGYVDIVVLVLITMMIIALGIKVFPAFMAKDRLNTFANEVLREAQIQGMIEIDYSAIAENIDINIDSVTWEANTLGDREVQLDEVITVTCTTNVEIGLFGDFGSFPIPLKSKATGKSEVYWKSE